jgi:imidazolonepropionase-like amidohydrolase
MFRRIAAASTHETHLMKRWLGVSTLTMAASCALIFSCSAPQKPILAITHVTVIDTTGAPPRPDMTLLLSEERIANIGASHSTQIPHAAQIVDGTGKFLIPGLADMHVHLTGAGEPGGSREFILPLLLVNGITTVRDMGGYLESLIPLRWEIAQGRRTAPQIIFAGPYLDGSPPFFQPALVVTNSAEATKDIHGLVQKGVDFIKVQSNLSRDAYFAIADICRREHITYVGHVPDRVTAAEASDAGQRSIEHLTGVLRACSSDEPRLIRQQFSMPTQKQTRTRSRERQLQWQRELLKTFSDVKAGELIDKFIRNETWQVPTLILLKNDAFPAPGNHLARDPRREYMPRQFLANWEKGALDRDKGATAAEFELRKAMLEKSLFIAGRMYAAGVRMMAGTDTTAPYVFPGSSLHEELSLLVEAGLTPMQALQAATKTPAEFLGKLETQGTIEPGKYADLVLLDANPLDDIHNTQKIRAIFLRGKYLGRTELDEILLKEEQFAAAH